MSDPIKIILPKLGESILCATVVKWFKKAGDPILRDEPLLEVATDKVNSEIPSPIAGFLSEIFAHPDQEIQVGEALGSISSLQSEAPSLSPAVLRLLAEKQIPLTSIGEIPHTGEGGRLTKKDVEGFCPKKSDANRIKMTPLRKAIADNMVKSFYQAPHATLITEVDVTELTKHIAQEKEAFLQEHGTKLSITSFIARAIAFSLESFPHLNASLDGDTIVVTKNVNLGVAVSIDQGIMVPVLHNCETMTLAQISTKIAALAEKARNNSLLPNETQEGSITMTNFGMTGIQIGIPIIRYPEAAIIGLGAITRKVVPMPDDTLAVRSIMMISLTFDHRIVDGLYGCGFLSEVKRKLETI